MAWHCIPYLTQVLHNKWYRTKGILTDCIWEREVNQTAQCWAASKWSRLLKHPISPKGVLLRVQKVFITFFSGTGKFHTLKYKNFFGQIIFNCSGLDLKVVQTALYITTFSHVNFVFANACLREIKSHSLRRKTFKNLFCRRSIMQVLAYYKKLFSTIEDVFYIERFKYVSTLHIFDCISEFFLSPGQKYSHSKILEVE